MSDHEIYISKEYADRIKRNTESLYALPSHDEQIRVAAESMAYWSMRAGKAERMLAMHIARDELKAGLEQTF
jgi:hypothetical protein